MNKNISDQTITELCNQCGLCCDGTLSPRARLKEKSEIEKVRSFNIDTENLGSAVYLILPCGAYNNQCSIYEHRPKVCRTYFCKPIQELKENNSSIEATKNLIIETVQLKEKFNSIRMSFLELKAMSINEALYCLDIIKQEQLTNKDLVETYKLLCSIRTRLLPLIKQF